MEATIQLTETETETEPRQALSEVASVLEALGAAPSSERGDTRERLLDAATARFAVYGFYGTSIRHITSDVSITAAGFYAHFSSKENLASVAIARGYAKFIREVALPGPDNNAVDALLALCARHSEFTSAESQATLLGNELLRAQLDALIQPDVRDAIRAAQRTYLTLVTRLIERARQETGGRTGVSDDLLAEAVLSLCETQITSPRPTNAFASATIAHRVNVIRQLLGF